jgi:YHS domain-containing protein
MTLNRPQLGRSTRLPKQIMAAALFAAVFGLSGCAAINSQNPSGSLKPVNAHAVQGSDSVILNGHDVVSYFTQGKHALGSTQFSSKVEGVTFLFASAEHKALFDKEPNKYIPQYGGYCANGIAYGIPWGGDADSWRIVDGKLYIFGGKGSKDAFELDIPGNLKLAEKYWNEEVKGSNSFIQRSKRMVMRVPHYKSGAELAAMVEAARKK